MSVGKNTLWQGRFKREACVEGLRSQVSAIRALLDQAGFTEVPAEGLLCMVGRNAGIAGGGLLKLPGAAVGVPEAVIDRASRPGPRGEQLVADVHDLFARVLPPVQPLVVPVEWTTEAKRSHSGDDQPAPSRPPRPARAAAAMLALRLVLIDLARSPAAPPRLRSSGCRR